jgi:hypothetical protein
VADEPTPEEVAALQEQLAAFPVDQFLVSTATTIASLAYAKLERGELTEAKKAIDALGDLVKHVEGELAPDLQLALSRLQLAFVQATS